MFNINLISKPGIQKNICNDSWSYMDVLEVQEPSVNIENKINRFKNNFFQYPLFIIFTFLLIIILELNSNREEGFKPAIILNQVIDIIVESGYKDDIQLFEAKFHSNEINVIIRSHKYSSIQALTRGHRFENDIPYVLFNKQGYSYLSLFLPWEVIENEGDIKTLKSLAEKTRFSNKISINSNDNEFQILGRATDIISYLLQMADKNQIQKFIFVVNHLESGEFNLKIKLNQS